MSRTLSFAMFFATLVALVLGLHWYLWSRLVRAPGWPQPWYGLATALIVVMSILVPAALPLARMLPRQWATPLATVAFVWMGFGFILVVATFATDMASWLGLGTFRLAKGAPIDPSRRELLARGTAGVSSLVAIGLGGLAFHNASSPKLKKVAVDLPRLPASLTGFRIVQLSDVHVGPTIGRDFIRSLVERTNELQPDLVVITGDLVDGSVEELAHHVEPLRELKAKHGVFFVTGNHEYYSGAGSWLRHLPTLGIRVLRNEHVRIGDGDASFDLAGTDDPQGTRFGNGHGEDLAKALAGRDPERALVLLAHQPKSIHEAANRGVGLQLSGHTHGGQIWPFGAFVPLQQPYVAGLHKHSEDTWIYVSRGTGYWGPPMRLGAPSEITEITLRAPAAA